MVAPTLPADLLCITHPESCYFCGRDDERMLRPKGGLLLRRRLQWQYMLCPDCRTHYLVMWRPSEHIFAGAI